MRRTAVFVLPLAAAVLVAVWWATARDDADAVRGPRGVDTQGPDATLVGRASEGADGDPAPLKTAPADAPDTPEGRRLAEAVDRLQSLRAMYEAGAVSVVELADAERKLLLARMEAGELTKQETHEQLARLDGKALARAEALYENMLCTQEDLWRARLRLHHSKHGAGHADERFESLRRGFLQFTEKKHAVWVQAGISSPRELHRQLLDACLEFPLDEGVRDLALERAGIALRDHLIAELETLQRRDSVGELLPNDDRRIALELEIVDLRLLLQDVDFHRAHTERARIFERRLRDLESREVGLDPSARDMAIARLRLHREKFLLEEEDEEYACLRAKLLRAEQERLDALVVSGRLGHDDRASELESLRSEFPPAERLQATRDGD